MTRAPAGVGCVVLAAGSATRFGSDKRLAAFGDGTLLDHTLAMLEAVFEDRVLVLRTGDEALVHRYTAQWQVVLAPDAAKGMGHSLAAAVPRIAEWKGVIVALGDMPFVLPTTFAAVAMRLSTDNFVVPFYQGRRGNPVGIGSRYFAELAVPQGDQGARILLQRHAAAVVKVEVEDPGILRDVDTPAALEAAGPAH